MSDRQTIHLGKSLCHLAILTALLAGCASNGEESHWYGPKTATVVTQQNVPDSNPPMTLEQTAHYQIYTTITDRPDLVAKTAQLMEGAFGVYRTMAPDVTPTNYPMKCFLFSDRVQWINFTEQHTGMSAPIYLKISRGAYTIHDWYVAYYIGDISTYSVAAHEGWHQFVNRHFRGRLPPFLEEGLACMYENVEWNHDLPQWNLSLNPARALSLRKAMDARELFPLDQLMKMDAGKVVNMPGIKIEAFYAQSWAFARYLWEGENGKFRPGLQKLFDDTAAGTVADPTGSLRRSYLPWNPAGVQSVLEQYLGEDLATLSQGYEQYMQKIAYDELKTQFEM
ncbi:MAG: hypothetical protein ABSG31_07195 [Tepidisphaeraceae bacterium]